MRREYGNALRTLFSERLTEALPRFQPVRVKSDYLRSGERAFRWSVSESVDGWIILSPSATGHQAFTVEVAWSARSRFPELSMRPSVSGARDVDLAAPPDEGALRLGTVDGDQERWWQLPDPAVEHPGSVTALAASLEPIAAEDARAAVAPHVEAAVGELVDRAVPWLASLCSRLEPDS